MSPLRLMQRAPSVAVAARALDLARGARVDALLAAHPVAVDDARAACDALLTRPDDDDARGRLASRAEALLAALRAPEAERGALRRGLARVDAALRSDGLELLDRDGFPQALKDVTMRLLHRTNVAAGSYDAWIPVVLEAVGSRAGAHVYDLAAGTGGFARHLSRARPGALRVTSSDRAPEYVGLGMERAAREGAGDITWEVCDALDLRAHRARGDVDLFLCTQAAHHFAPGLLVQMIAHAVAAAREGLLVVDLARAASTAVGTALVGGVVAPWPVLMYDGWQSVRRAYTPAEFTLLARLAGAGRVDARPFGPAWCVMHAR